LSAAEDAEKRYQQAVELEKIQQEVFDAQQQAEIARKAKLPRRLPNVANTWKTRFQEEGIKEPLTKFDQENVVYTGGGPRLSLMGARQVPEDGHMDIFEVFHEQDDFDEDLVDPVLISESRLISQSCGQVYEEVL
jgi:hypothetical protein